MNNMAIHVSRREVFTNIHTIKENVIPLKDKKRFFHAAINCDTGDIKFVEHIPSEGKWKEVRVDVNGTFELREPDDTPIKHSAMAKVAWRVLNETLEAVNKMLHSPGKEVAYLKYQSIEDKPGWVGAVGRIEAEKKLIGKPLGTYVLRLGDEYTQVTANNLSETNKKFVKAYICTHVESEGKISDSLFLLTDDGWTHYRDNPDLSDSEYKYHNSPESLINHLHVKRALT